MYSATYIAVLIVDYELLSTENAACRRQATQLPGKSFGACTILLGGIELSNESSTCEKVYVTNITSDKIIAADYIPSGLHKMVCDCRYESGLNEYQVVRILYPSEYQCVKSFGFFCIPIDE